VCRIEEDGADLLDEEEIEGVKKNVEKWEHTEQPGDRGGVLVEGA
jgi:hypothetical protein